MLNVVLAFLLSVIAATPGGTSQIQQQGKQ